MLYTKIVLCKKKNFKVGRNYGEYYNNLKIHLMIIGEVQIEVSLYQMIFT